MKKIWIEEKNNGYLVGVMDFIKFGGVYVFKSTENIAMIEFIGRLLADADVKVELR